MLWVLDARRIWRLRDLPVCRWEDDPTTIFEPGERGGPGPNHLSLTEGRRNFAEQGISKPRLKDRVTVRASLSAERP